MLFAQQMEAQNLGFQGRLMYEYEMQFDDSCYFFFSEARLPWPFRVWNFPFASRRRLQAPEQPAKESYHENGRGTRQAVRSLLRLLDTACVWKS